MNKHKIKQKIIKVREENNEIKKLHPVEYRPTKPKVVYLKMNEIDRPLSGLSLEVKNEQYRNDT